MTGSLTVAGTFPTVVSGTWHGMDVCPCLGVGLWVGADVVVVVGLQAVRGVGACGGISWAVYRWQPLFWIASHASVLCLSVPAINTTQNYLDKEVVEKKGTGGLVIPPNYAGNQMTSVLVIWDYCICFVTQFKGTGTGTVALQATIKRQYPINYTIINAHHHKNRTRNIKLSYRYVFFWPEKLYTAI